MLAALVCFVRLPAADFPILHPVKVVSLRDLHHAQTFRFPLVARARTRPRRSTQRFDFRVWGEIANRQ